MSIFKKLFGSKSKHYVVPANCDLVMVRDEIADMHKLMNSEAEKEGGSYVFEEKYVSAWEAFCANPTLDNAETLLEIAPMLIHYFESCAPGGSLYITSAYLNEHGLKK